MYIRIVQGVGFDYYLLFYVDSYEDGETLLRKVSSAANFIWSDSPLEILGSVTSITFSDPADLIIKDHELTTEEVLFVFCDQAVYSDLNNHQGT